MPPDDLQRAILATLAANRSPGSVIAGGIALQFSGIRLSDVIDIFHAEESAIAAHVKRDLALLAANGYAFDVTKAFSGFVEARVGTEAQGFTAIQWTVASAAQFFKTVPDESMGWRLHFLDLATNKLLAAASRVRVRDYVDLYWMHRAAIPIATLAWAAPAKDPAFSPSFIVERLARTFHFARSDYDEVALIDPVDPTEIARTIWAAIDDAREWIGRMPSEQAPCLYMRDGKSSRDLTPPRRPQVPMSGSCPRRAAPGLRRRRPRVSCCARPSRQRTRR